jgi:ribonuclease G
VVNKELIIDSESSEVNIALLEDKVLVELNKEKSNNKYAVGDVYLGRVRKIMPGLNAAFVDVGYEKDAFLHYLDLGPQVNSLNKFVKLAIEGKVNNGSLAGFETLPDIDKTGRISSVLVPNQPVLFQIAKEPISTKGPRITSELAYAGRYLVMVPFSNRISVSQKIKSVDERNRLKRLIQSIRPKNCGIIIRTVAENKMVADLDADLRNLVQKWENTTSKLRGAEPPQKVISEIDRASAILRDILSDSFNNVYVNDPGVAEEIKNYIRKIFPDKVDIVKLYRGKSPIFEHFSIDKQIKSAFGKIVTIKSGVYLIIEHTEALHVIDINSGHRVNSDNTQESNALAVNLEAAAEVARQLRLRDMGGIIVVDFIDMQNSQHRRELFQRLKDEMSKDRAKHAILPPSKFGLVQITRQRVRPEMTIQVLEKCPACDGSGKVKSSIVLIDDIENNLHYLINDQNEKHLKLLVHPYIYAFLTKGLISLQLKWFFKYGKWIRIKKMSSYHMLEYHFFNKNDDEINI